MLKQAALQFRFMRIHIFLLVFVVGFALVGESYGQTDVAPQEDPSLPEVSLQLQLRNSDGQLVTYIEPTTMYISNIKWVHEFLDTKENKIIEFCLRDPNCSTLLINAGIYLVKPETVCNQRWRPLDKFSIEDDFFPEVIKSQNIYGFITHGRVYRYWRSK